MFLVKFCLLAACVAYAHACVATTSTSTTTTTACCSTLTTSTLTRVSPSSSAQQQCSILRRISSSCPTTGLVLCDAAPDTNPTSITIELLSSSGTVVRTFTSQSTSVSATLTCVSGVWEVANTAGTSYTAVSQVSCSQLGSTGTDLGNVSG